MKNIKTKKHFDDWRDEEYKDNKKARLDLQKARKNTKILKNLACKNAYSDVVA